MIHSVEFEPVRAMSVPLWNREKQFKRSHYFDIATLIVKTTEEWTAQGCGANFSKTARDLLLACYSAGMAYERMYLTLFWVLCSPYWAEIASFLLEKRMLYLSDVDWRLTCKEITFQVARTWFFPESNVQTISSAYYLNAEDLVGYADVNPNAGAISWEILEYAVDNFDYNFPSAEDQTFEAYLRQFDRRVELLLEPMYQKFADKVMTYEEALDTRVVWGASGTAVRRATELLGLDSTPAGT